MKQPRRVSAGESAEATPAELIEEMIARASDWRGRTFARLRSIIHKADPDMVEEVKWRRPSNPLGAPLWTHNGVVCSGGILKERVRLTFVAGTILPDPKRLFNSMLNGKSRAIDFYEGDKIDGPAVTALIRAAVEHNLSKGRRSTPRKA